MAEEFPDGKLGPHDEGALSISFLNHKGRVIINFGKSVVWIGMTPDDCRAFAKRLIEHADDIEEKG